MAQKRYFILLMLLFFTSCNSGVDEVQVSFEEDDNKAPIAIAGDDKNLEYGSIVTFDASNSYDLDGSIVSYKWIENDTILSFESSFQKSDLTQGIHTITLIVKDNSGEIGTDEIVVNLYVVNKADPVDPPELNDVVETTNLVWDKDSWNRSNWN